jgi:hypothetical protein
MKHQLVSNSFIVIAVILLGLYGATANAASPVVSNVYVPLQGEVTLPNGDTVFLAGRVHILSRVTFSDAFVPTVDLYVNLIGVEGTSDTTGRRYLVVGASNVEWVGTSPGPPDISEQTFNFSLVETNPGPPELPPSPILPVFLRDFVYAQEAGSEGSLQGVVASFLSD